jgi:two-component system sensor histidine kinase KdpD
MSSDAPLGRPPEPPTSAAPAPRPRRRPRPGLDGHLAALGLVALASALGALVSWSGLAGIVLVYVTAVLLAAWRLGLGPAILAGLLGVAAHAYLFVPPQFSLAITQVPHLMALATMTVVVLVVATLTAQLRRYADLADLRARHADALRSLSREFLEPRGREPLLRLAAEHVGAQLGGRAVVATRAGTGALEAVSATGTCELEPVPRSLAERVLASRAPSAEAAGEAHWHGVPLGGDGDASGALLLRRGGKAEPLTGEEARLLDGYARLTEEALARERLAREAERARVEAGSERLRNALLSGVSHDFRTPLAVIIGATSHLVAEGDALDAAARADLARTAEGEARRLHRLVGDLLALTRLDAGAMRVEKEWQPLEDVVGVALGRLRESLGDRPVRVRLPADLPMVPLDAVLIEQVVFNLLDNAVKHTAAGVPVEVTARADPTDGVVVEVLDGGPGIPAGELEAVFGRFHRGDVAKGDGVGLGLAVCRGIVSVHGGRIWAENRPAGGVAFRFTLPLEGVPPLPPPREATEQRRSA